MTTIQEFYAGLEEVRKTGDLEAYENYIRKEMALNAMCCGKVGPIDVAGSNELGILYMALGRNEEAVSRLEDAVNLSRRMVGEKTLEYVSAARNLAQAKHKVGDTKEAFRLIKQSLSILKEIGGEDSDFYSYGLSDAAQFSMALGNIDDAIDYSVQAATHAEAMNRSVSDCAIAYGNLGMCYMKADKKEEAKEALTKATEYADKMPEAYAQFMPLYSILKSLQ